MPGESLSFPIYAPDHASGNIREVGDAAAKTAAKLDIAAASAKLWNDTTIKSGKAADTALASMKAHEKATGLLADAEAVLAGKATTTTKLIADQGREIDKTAKSAERAAGAGGATGLSALIGAGGAGGGSGMAGLIAAGVALSPVIATVGVGLAGFGAAAVAVAQPILKAAQATGGLQANMSKLDPEQRKVAQGLLGLGQQFDVFEKALAPQVLGVFNQGIQIAGHLLRDVQPVARATGTALGGMLAQIDREFQSGTWQNFFGFMARTAGPDIALLSQTFVNLTAALPPLLELLQPTATDILAISAGLSKLVKAGADAGQGLDKTTQHENFLAKTTDLLRTALFAPGVGLYHALKLVGIISSGPAATGIIHTGMAVGDLIHPLGDAARHAGLFADNTGMFAVQARNAKPPVFNLTQAITALNKSMTTLVGNLLTLQGSNLGWKQSMQAAEKQLRSNTAGLEGNSAKALANKQAVLATTNAAIQFASEELTLHKDIGGASDTIQAQIRFLQGLHDKSSFVKAEIHALRDEEAKLNAQRLHQVLTIGANATWSVTQLTRSGVGPMGSKPLATGGRVPGYGGGDRFPALLEGGEAVVPKHLTPALAPFLKAHGVPGFAAGGLVPAYSGDVGGVQSWVRGNDAATIRIIDAAVARVVAAALRAAQTFGGGLGRAGLRWLENLWMSAGGPGGGTAHVAAAIALAESGGSPIAYNASGASGLWQILGQVVPGNIFNPFINAENAVKKYRDAGGFSPWVTFETGAYRQFMDQGGWLQPGWNPPMYNGTGRPEHLVPAGGGNTYNIHVHVPPSANKADIGRQVVELIKEHEKRNGNGWRR